MSENTNVSEFLGISHFTRIYIMYRVQIDLRHVWFGLIKTKMLIPYFPCIAYHS